MSDVTFRTEQPAPQPETLPAATNPAHTANNSNVEVPYLDYPRAHGQAFVVDHYQLGETWSNSLGGFEKEVNTIEAYFRHKVETGEFPNSVSYIKDRLKEIEKVTNTSKEERPAHKLGTIAAYVRFLAETDDIKHNIKRYGTQ